MGLSLFAEKKALDDVFGNASFSATIEVALSSADPGKDGASINEPGEASYARVLVTNNGTNFPAAAGTPTNKTNGVDIAFPSALEDWEAGADLTHIALFDAGGINFLASGVLSAARKVLIGDTFVLQAGDLDIGLADA